MKLGLTPFKEFSLNCFSSILFSLLDYVEPDNKLIVFANNYNYEIREIKQTVSTNVFKTLSVKSDITLLEEVLLQNKMTLNLKTYNENLITDKIIELLEQNKIILVEIDLFYGVKDSLHYKKNHLNHMVMMNGYDNEKQVFYIYDAGNKGYKEYDISFEQLIKAIISATGKLNFYNLGRDTKSLHYDLDAYIHNAANIIVSLQNVFENISSIWNIKLYNSDEISYFSDKVLPNLFGIKNRQNANKKLIVSIYEIYGKINVTYYEQEFRKLEEAFGRAELLFAKMCRDGTILENIDDFRVRILNLFKEESNIWEKFIMEAMNI